MSSDKQTILAVGSAFEKYRIEGVLGKGGMGEVYLLRHQLLDSHFALKILFPEIAQRNQKFVDRFIREAKLAAKIHHPNLVAVYDAGQHAETGIYYIIMEYVSGGNVRELLKREEKLTEKRALEITAQIAEALVAAHSHHMVHRDIKPDNIMFSAEGVAKLADLGIAKSTGDKDTQLTVDVSVFGTPAYMSPEQALDSRMVDSRSDIYSLGIVLYEMLTGNKPFTGKTSIEILAQVLREVEIQDIRTKNPAVSAQTAELIACMVAKKMENRPATPAELLARLRMILEHKPSPASRRPPAVLGRAASADEDETHATAASWSCNAETHSRGPGSESAARYAATAMTVGVPPPQRKTVPPLKGGDEAPVKRASAGLRWLILPLLAFLAAAGYWGYTYYRASQTRNTIAALVIAVNTALDQKDTTTAAAKVAEMEVLDAPRAVLYRKKVELAAAQLMREQETAEKNAHVSRLRSEIDSALERRDAAMASARIVELTKLNEALAAPYRSRLDSFVRENDATPAYVKARAAKESIDQRNLDMGQGIGGRLREMNEAFVELDMAWQVHKWGDIVAKAGKVLTKCAELETLDRLRRDAVAQKEVADKARRAAEQAEAPTLAEQLFTEGEKASIRAGASFESGDFDVAMKDWKAATSAYGLASVAVKDARAYGKAKESFETESQQYAALFEKHGGAKWKETLEKERLAMSLRNNPEQGKRAYEEAHALLLVARDEANARKLIAEKEMIQKVEEVKTAQNGQNYVLMAPGEIPLELIWIKAGSFSMGSPKDELERRTDETLHRVTLTKGYWLGKYEVTQEQWEAVMGMNPSKFTNVGKRSPVEHVSWEDAIRFCEKVTQLEKEAGRLPPGYVYTLPTEAQWEYACRAGTSTPLNSGKTPVTREGACPLMDEVGWYGENSHGAPRPVGGKKANAWGFFDMHGNVWEWCRDQCTRKEGVLTDTYVEGVADPLCKTGIARVCRGGGCFSGPGSCWSANRSMEPPTSKNGFIGFRLALAPTQ